LGEIVMGTVAILVILKNVDRALLRNGRVWPSPEPKECQHAYREKENRSTHDSAYRGKSMMEHVKRAKKTHRQLHPYCFGDN
jgi:hypothetical protein